MNPKLKMSLAETDIPVRIVNALESKSIFTVYDLLMKRPEEITKIENLGQRSLDQIYKALAKLGYYRKKNT